MPEIPLYSLRTKCEDIMFISTALTEGAEPFSALKSDFVVVFCRIHLVVFA